MDTKIAEVTQALERVCPFLILLSFHLALSVSFFIPPTGKPAAPGANEQSVPETSPHLRHEIAGATR